MRCVICLSMASEKPRPYWHVDAKWVFGILFGTTLLVNLVVFALAKLTSENIAIPLATQIVAQQFSKNGLDAEGDIEDVKQKFLRTGEERFYPFGKEQDVYLTREDVQTLSPREIRLKVFRQVVEPIYYKKSKLDLQQYGFIGIINIDTHALLQRLFVYSLFPLGIFLAGLVFFSYRFGKLVNPAFQLIFTAGPVALLLYLLGHTTPPAGDTGPFSVLPQEIKIEIVRAMAGPFNFYTLLGIGLLGLAVLIKVGMKLQNTKN